MLFAKSNPQVKFEQDLLIDHPPRTIKRQHQPRGILPDIEMSNAASLYADDDVALLLIPEQSHPADVGILDGPDVDGRGARRR